MKMEDQIRIGQEREAREREIPPFSGLQIIGRSRDGSPIWGPIYKHVQAESDQVLPPRWKYVGIQSPQYVFGELTWRNQDRASNDWPRDPDIEPANPAAVQVAEYYAKHRGNPALPRKAWDVEANRLCEIPADAPPYVAPKTLEPQPALLTRGLGRQNAHQARRRMTEGDTEPGVETP